MGNVYFEEVQVAIRKGVQLCSKFFNVDAERKGIFI